MNWTLKLTTTLLVLGVLAGCSPAPSDSQGKSTTQQQGSTTGALACPSEWEDATEALVLSSDTKSQRSEVLVSERLAVVRAQLESAAGCGIPVTVMWVPSQTTAVTLFSGSVRRKGSNDLIIARLSRKDINEVAMPAIEARISELVSVPAVEQSSPSGLFDVISDFRGTSKSTRLAVVVLDNFVEESGRTNANRPGFDADAVKAAVTASKLPDLKGTTISIMGAGVTADTTPAPDDWVSSIRAYADALCSKTNATCSPATTQYLR